MGKVIEQLGCLWPSARGGTCNKPTVKGDYCWTHWPLALIGYQTPVPKASKSKPKKHEDLRDSFREELERDFSEGKHRSLSLKRQDFPRHVDGIWFETLDDYSMYATGDVAWGEDISSDSLYFDSAYKRSQKQLPFLSSGGELQKLVNYKPRPKVTLKVGEYKILDNIQHMHYVVARAKDQLYYAVWLSLLSGDKDFALCEILKELPVVGVQQRTGYAYHASKGCLTYLAAEDFFHKGGETFYRIRERIKKTEDPTYFPPNLRAMAVMGRWDDIPEKHRATLKEWKRKGCKGWYGKRSFDTNWKDSRII